MSTQYNCKTVKYITMGEIQQKKKKKKTLRSPCSTDLIIFQNILNGKNIFKGIKQMRKDKDTVQIC